MAAADIMRDLIPRDQTRLALWLNNQINESINLEKVSMDGDEFTISGTREEAKNQYVKATEAIKAKVIAAKWTSVTALVAILSFSDAGEQQKWHFTLLGKRIKE